MAQSEIISYLLANRGRPVDVIELMGVIPANRYSISRALRKLRQRREVQAKQVRIGSFHKWVYTK